MSLRKNLKAIFLAMAGFTCFGFGDTIYKCLNGKISVYGATFFTGVFATICLILASRLLGGLKDTISSRKLPLHCLRAVLSFLQFLLIIYALQNMAIAKVYTIVFLYPLLSVIFGKVFFNEHVHWQQWLAIALGFIGILIILRPGFIPIEPAAAAALGVAFLAAIVNQTMVRFIGQGETQLSFGLYPELAALIGGGVFWLPHAVLPEGHVLFLLICAGILNAGGILLVSRGFAAAPAAVIAPFGYIQMLWGIALSCLFLQDRFDIWMAAGALCIIISGIGMIYIKPKFQNRNILNLYRDLSGLISPGVTCGSGRMADFSTVGSAFWP